MKLTEEFLKMLRKKYRYTKREISSLRKLNAKKFYFVEPRKDKLPEGSK